MITGGFDGYNWSVYERESCCSCCLSHGCFFHAVADVVVIWLLSLLFLLVVASCGPTVVLHWMLFLDVLRKPPLLLRHESRKIHIRGRSSLRSYSLTRFSNQFMTLAMEYATVESRGRQDTGSQQVLWFAQLCSRSFWDAWEYDLQWDEPWRVVSFTDDHHLSAKKYWWQVELPVVSSRPSATRFSTVSHQFASMIVYRNCEVSCHDSNMHQPRPPLFKH